MPRAFVSLLHGDHRRLVTHDALVFNVNQGVSCPQINREIVGKDADEAAPTSQAPFCAQKSGLKQRENNRFSVFKQDNEKIKEKRIPDGTQKLATG